MSDLPEVNTGGERLEEDREEIGNDIINELSNSIKPNLIRSSMTATGNQESNPKYLVVDDLIVPNKTYRERFVARLKSVPLEKFLFAANYEEANRHIESASNIVFCFVDCVIPQSENEEGILERMAEESDRTGSLPVNNLKLAEWGIKLIAEHQDLKMMAISAHLDTAQLRQLAKQYKNIIDTAPKPFKASALESIRQEYIEPYYPQVITVKEDSSLVSRRQKAFDYSSLDDETLSFLQSRTEEIRRLLRRTSQDIVDIGNYLIEVKERLAYGQFYKWLEAEFHWSYVSASRFMGVAEKFGSSSFNVKELAILPTALYELLPPSVPEEAIAEVFEVAKSGQVVGRKIAKEIKDKYKTVKEQAESKVQLKKVEQVEPERTENRERRLSVDSVSQPLSGLPEKDRPKQEILAVVPSQNAVKNSWWQLGSHNQLFCGEPKSHEFLKRLPKDIGLSMTFLPKGDLLVPPIESIVACTFHLKYEDTDLDSAIETLIRETTKPGEIVVFNYLCHIELLEVAKKLKCHFIVAEPDLEKCEKILTFWREKGSVSRIKN